VNHWEEVARDVMTMLSRRDISPDLAERWLRYLVDYAEMGGWG
jgi:hypothetical protein